MVSFVKGVTYNLRGMLFAFKRPQLLSLGLIRFAVVILLTTLTAGTILYHHQDILNLIWMKPESVWLVWLWHAVSWLLSLLLAGVCVILSYLLSQLLFAVIIMDAMSRITERISSGHKTEQEQTPLLQQFFYLVRQEIPRTTLPVLVALLLMALGWLTPLGPLLTMLATAMTVIFLSWDNTDLVPARRDGALFSPNQLFAENIAFPPRIRGAISDSRLEYPSIVICAGRRHTILYRSLRPIA